MKRILFLALLAGCPGTDTDTDVDTGADTDTSADTDTGADTDTDTDTDIDTDTDTDTDTSDIQTVTAVMGERCEPHDQIGEVRLSVQGNSVNVTATVRDSFPAIPATPTASTDYCDYYTFDPSICGDCDGGEICMPDGQCAVRPASLQTPTLAITVDGVTTELENTSGYIYGNSVATADDTLDVALRWPGYVVSLTDAYFPAAVTGLSASASGGWDAPGTVTMTWDPSRGGGVVFTDIPMNHHIAVPAFTRCEASVSVGSMSATPAMIDPLAQSTGLEFQGFQIEVPAAAQTDDGCIQFTLGMQEYTSVSYPNASF